MQTLILLAAVLVIPAVWGWFVSALLVRLWPMRRERGPGARATTELPGPPVDFQI